MENIKTPTINERVASYWQQLVGPEGVHSTSHHVYRGLVQDFGQAAVDAALEPHIALERAATARREAETVRKFYESDGLSVPPVTGEKP